MSTASPELLKRLTDRQMNDEKKKRWLSAEVREKGYQLAVRELYGENSEDYWKKKRAHDQSLHKLYRLERKV
jgi:hypothetical protein